MTVHFTVFRRLLEAWTGAAIRGVDAIQRQISAALAWVLAIAFDLASFAFVTVLIQPLALRGILQISAYVNRRIEAYHAKLIYRLRFARP